MRQRVAMCPVCGNDQEVKYRKVKRCIYCGTPFVLQGKNVKIVGKDYREESHEL